MQILHSQQTFPQASTGDFGGLVSLPVLEQQERLSVLTISSAIHEGPQMSYSAQRNSIVPSGSSRNETILNEENDDNLPAYFVLNTSADATPMDTSNYVIENGDTPMIATGNERNDPSDGDNNRPPGDHYNDDRRRRNHENGNQDNEDDDEEMIESNQDPSIFPDGNTEVKSGDAFNAGRATLIVNLYPPNRGYTFCCFVPRGGLDDEDDFFHQSHIIPYSETYLLDCIDSESIPLRLLTKLDKYDGVNLMCYQNNVLCEIRDFRRFPSSTINPSPLVQHVVLRATNQSILSDLDSLIEKSFEDRQMYKKMQLGGRKTTINGDDTGGPGPVKRAKLENGDGFEQFRTSDDSLSLEQKLELEKEIIRATAPLLCLEPSRGIGLLANQVQYERLKWNSEELKKSVVTSAKRREKVRKAMEKEIDNDDLLEDIYSTSGSQETRSFMPFYRFVRRKQQQKKIEKGAVTESLTLPAITYTEFPPLLPPANLEDILKLGQPAEPATLRPMFSENYVKRIEEYILETERRKRPHTTRLNIYQRNGSESYFGELEQESFIEPNGFNGTNNSVQSALATARANAYSSEARVDPHSIIPGSLLFPSTKCQFELGSSKSVQLYVKQFTDIFTEDGRRPCKITYQKFGQLQPQIVYTNSYKSLATANNNNNNITAATTNSNPAVAGIAPVSTSQGNVGMVTLPTSVSSSNPTASAPTQPSLPASGSPTGSSSSQPPVQIVHPQPRSSAQQIQPIQIYTSLGTATMVSSPTTMTVTTNTSSSTAANVNFSLNVNSTRVRQQLLTRPQIINVNVQQQHPTQHIIRQAAPQLIQSQVAQQQGIRIKQPTLATLLLTGLHPNSGSKPITVAIQPQPQHGASSTSNTAQMQTIQIGNALDSQGHNQHIVHHQTQQQHHQSTSSPIMIMVAPATGNSQNTINIPSNNSTVNQQGHSGSVSLNLNTISLDGLLSSVGNASSMSNYITTTVASSGSTTMQMPMGLSNQLNTLNILRLSNNTNTVTLQPQQHAALMRQGNISVMNQTGRSVGQQHHTLMNMNATGILINQATANAQAQANILNNANNMGNQHNVNMSIIQKSGAGQTRVQVQAPAVQELEELPDLNSLLNTNSNGNSTNFHTGSGQSASRNMDGRGLNLDLNLNLNLNLSGHTHSQGPSSASVSASRQYNQGHSTNGTGESVDGVDSFFNALSEAIGPELGQKLDGSSGHTQGIVSSSMSPSTSKTSSSVITLNDLLGSPPMIVSSSTSGGGPPAQSPLQMQLQSPQSPSISSILSPISPNLMGAPASVPSSLAYSTPRLSALLAGTPSADSPNTMTSLVDSSMPNTGNRGTSGSSYGNLLDRLAASRSQPQITQRTGGSLLSPIATATPSVVLEHPVLAATLTQGPNPNLHLRQGLTRPSYRQIAPAPAPQQQLINLLGLVSNPTNPGGSNSTGQSTIRINSGKPSPGAGSNLGNR